jgi:hypothetical protein
MKKLAYAVLCVVGIWAGSTFLMGTYRYAIAQGEAASPDAGLVVDADPASGPSKPSDPGTEKGDRSDPVEDPGGYATDVLDAYRAAQYAFLIVLVLWGISHGVIYVDDRWDTPRIAKARPYIVIGSSVLGSAILSLYALSTIDLRAVVGAIVAACVLEMRGQGKHTVTGRAEAMYQAYATQTGWKSAVTGAPLPPWREVPDAVRKGWLAAASVV